MNLLPYDWIKLPKELVLERGHAERPQAAPPPCTRSRRVDAHAGDEHDGDLLSLPAAAAAAGGRAVKSASLPAKLFPLPRG